MLGFLKSALQPSSSHDYSEVSPLEFSEAFIKTSAYRIAVLSYEPKSTAEGWVATILNTMNTIILRARFAK